MMSQMTSEIYIYDDVAKHFCLPTLKPEQHEVQKCEILDKHNKVCTKLLPTN